MVVFSKRKIINKEKSLFFSFTRRVALFLFIGLLILLAIVLSARLLASSSTKLDVNTTVIIIGDSHMNSGVIDSIITHSINVSRTTQPYIYSYYVLKNILSNNPQIDTVLLGYSFHSLSPIFDLMIYNKKFAEKFNTRENTYLAILPCTYVTNYIKLHGAYKLYTISLAITLNFVRNFGKIDYFPFLGKYYYSCNHNLNEDNVNAAIQKHYHSSNTFGGVMPPMQEHYLISIAELCNHSEIELYLVNTPISQQYYECIPEEYIQNYYTIASEINVPLLDYHDYPLPDSCYGDADHLNYYGAREFTLVLNSFLQN